MRDQPGWEREKTVSPALVRACLGALGLLCIAWALAALVFSALAAGEGRYGPAAIQMLSGLAAPFAVWLAVRLLADLVILQHRQLARTLRPARLPPASARASDDGPNYEADEA